MTTLICAFFLLIELSYKLYDPINSPIYNVVLFIILLFFYKHHILCCNFEYAPLTNVLDLNGYSKLYPGAPYNIEV